MSLKSDKIFVQVPAYRDSQLGETIRDMLVNAFNPERLQIVVGWQHEKSEKIPGDLLKHRNIKIIDIDCSRSKGANWARSIIQKHWNGEPYSLLIDSHMRFVKHWDKKLISMMLGLQRNKFGKPIISGFPPAFDPLIYPKKRTAYPVKMYSKNHERNLLTKFYGLPIPLYNWLKEPIPADFLAMNFLFTEGIFNKEIPFDPNIYFFGDDITTGIRAFCHGYNFYHPHRVIIWHLYDRTTRIPHWDDHKNWGRLEEKSHERIRRILSGEKIDRYSIGNKRTIEDYEKYIGMKLIL